MLNSLEINHQAFRRNDHLDNKFTKSVINSDHFEGEAKFKLSSSGVHWEGLIETSDAVIISKDAQFTEHGRFADLSNIKHLFKHYIISPTSDHSSDSDSSNDLDEPSDNKVNSLDDILVDDSNEQTKCKWNNLYQHG